MDGLNSSNKIVVQKYIAKIGSISVKVKFFILFRSSKNPLPRLQTV